MRATSVTRRNSLDDATAADISEVDEETGSTTVSVAKVLIIFLAGVILASGLVSLSLWNYKKEVIKFVKQEDKMSGKRNSMGQENYIFVVHDFDYELKKERIISYDTTNDLINTLCTVSLDPMAHKLSNPQVSSDGTEIFFCKAALVGQKKTNKIVAQIWKMDLNDGNSGMIVEDAGYCDYSVKRSTNTYGKEPGLIYTNDDGHVYFFNTKTRVATSLTKDVDINFHSGFISPVLLDDTLFFIDIASLELHKIELKNPEASRRTLVKKGSYYEDSKLRISPDGKMLVIVDPTRTRTAEIMSISPSSSFSKKFFDITDILISEDGKNLFILSVQDHTPDQCAITKIDLDHKTGKETFLSEFEISSMHGIDLMQ